MINNYVIRLFMMIICISVSIGTAKAQCDVLAINSVLLDPNGTNNFDTDGSGVADTNEEFAEVCNLSGAAIDLNGYTLQDDDGNSYVLPSYSLAAGGCVFIVTDYGTTPVPANVIDLNGSAYINNGGDYVQILDPSGELICEVAAGGVSCPGDDGADCVNFPGDTDGCVNTAAEGAVNCNGTLAGADIPGCTDPDACNFDPAATMDDGTCDLGNLACPNPCTDIAGCTDPAAANYNPAATCDDGSCTVVSVPGCTNPAACNYDPAANADDGTCDLGNITCPDPCNAILGCPDPTATNYNPAATCDDGTCQFAPTCSPQVITFPANGGN